MDERPTNTAEPQVRTQLPGHPMGRDRRRWAGYFPLASLTDFHLPGTLASRVVSAPPVPSRHESCRPPAVQTLGGAARPILLPRRLLLRCLFVFLVCCF